MVQNNYIHFPSDNSLVIHFKDNNRFDGITQIPKLVQCKTPS